MVKENIIRALRSCGFVNPELPPPQPDFMQGVNLPQYYPNGRRKILGFDLIRLDDETTEGINRKWLEIWVDHARGVGIDRGQRATAVLGDSPPDGIGSLSGLSPSDDDVQRIVSPLSETSESDLERDMVVLREDLERARIANEAALEQLRAGLVHETHGGDEDVTETTAMRKRRSMKGMISAIRRVSKETREKVIRTIEEMKAREGEEVSVEELFGAAVASYEPTQSERRRQIVEDNAALNVPEKTRIRDIFRAIGGRPI